MDKDLKQTVKFYRWSSKKVVALSFLVAVQATSCVNGRRQGFRNSSSDIDLSSLSAGSFEFNEVKDKIKNQLLKLSPDLNGQTAFFQAVEKCNLNKVQYLVKNLSLTSKEVLKGLRLALKHKDTLSFRYKHKDIVHYLLKEGNLSIDDLCAQDDEGNTLLNLLIKRGDIDGIELFAGKLTLEGLCVQDSKGRMPMHLVARYKSKKIFEKLFSIIYKLDSARAIKELFKKDKSGYSVIERSYLPKDKHYAALFNNSHIQLPTFYRKGSEMFKFILKVLPDRLNPNQLVTIAIRLEEILEGKTIYKGYAATLRSILGRHIENRYGLDAEEVIRYVAYKRYLAYIKKKYGSNSNAVREYKCERAQLFATIEQKYGSKSNEIDPAVDEGYVSN